MRGLFFLGVGAIYAAGCSAGASNDPALGARMRIAGAEFVAGATPSDHAGPAVASVDLLTTIIWPGYSNKPVRGSLAASATAVTLALSGDYGYWVVPAGVPDVSAPELPTFRAVAAFAQNLAPGSYTLEVRAVDDSAHFGAARRQTLIALPFAPSRATPGALNVTLSWDVDSDLDLHVVDPAGSEIFHGSRSSRDPFAQNTPASSYGTLDVDSDAECRADGLRQEDVVWAEEPPSGRYLVRVDTTSLCGRPNAHWLVTVTLDHEPLASAAGIALDSDTWGPHDRGAGVLALGFDVP